MPAPLSTTCPQCGHSLEEGMKQESTYSSNPAANAFGNDIPTLRIQQEDVPRMEAEVERLSALIRSLHEERTRLLRKINCVQATTRRLPPEILSIIFQLIRPPIDFSSRQTLAELPDDLTLRRETYNQEEDLQLDLGAVCHQWRQYAWSTPQLWTSISVEVFETVAENNAAILDLYFQNARTLPMTVELDMRAQLYKLPDSEDVEKRSKVFSRLESIRNTVFITNAHKIQRLILLGLPLEWSTCVGPNLNSCQDLALLWPISYTQEAEYDLAGLSQLPSLRRIAFRYLSASVAIPSSVTVIAVQLVSIYQCFVLLTTCPNLLEFKLSLSTHNDSSIPPTNLGERVVISRLQKLDWYLCENPWNIAFLRRSVNFNEFNDAGERVMIDILTNLPSSITSLGFVYSLGPAVITAMRMMGRSIAAFQAPDMTDFRIRNGVISNTEGPKVLASLHTLILACGRQAEVTFKLLFEMLEAFHTATKHWRRAPFKLVILRQTGQTDELDAESEKKATELMNSGFDLEIVWDWERRVKLSSFEDGV
ncbi:hypothetical protein NP233_g5352 [Leucocoprinus birnbaumii]|uniref:F-box domain-containing protein n=1 Tax=Leucocoprinus birnbaumii TaxID=56174 RepID=A0AAD5YUP4_9AGAR|nr:hypothetical protein NP233_g5352 [Leucocoprinus birnbaumii]